MHICVHVPAIIPCVFMYASGKIHPVSLRMGKATLSSQYFSPCVPPLASINEVTVSPINCSNQGTLGEEPQMLSRHRKWSHPHVYSCFLQAVEAVWWSLLEGPRHPAALPASPTPVLQMTSQEVKELNIQTPRSHSVPDLEPLFTFLSVNVFCKIRFISPFHTLPT